MGVSTLHHHFRTLTAMSSLQCFSRSVPMDGNIWNDGIFVKDHPGGPAEP